MQAVILAAGMGKRLKELTQHNTKCMVKVNGTPLIDRLCRQLEKHRLSKIVLVVGYEGQKLIDFVLSLDLSTPVTFVFNPIYDQTNNIYSLYLAKDYLCSEDTLLFESDLIFEDSLIDLLLADPRDSLALVDKYESWMDGTCITLNPDDSIERFIPKKSFHFSEKDRYYKTVNIYKFSRTFSRQVYVPFLEAYCRALGNNEYYEAVLKVIIALDEPLIRAKRLNGERWYEIDDCQDLDIASSLFSDNEAEQTALLQQRYGGYWRYPKLLDFCYLVNPYFPPQACIDEMKSCFEPLLTQYPSGMKVNSLLAAKNFSLHPENIVVGNGAAECIRSLMTLLKGKIGFVRPTFEEYPNRCPASQWVPFFPDNDGFTYTADDCIRFFDPVDISEFVLINPDNPSGNYLPKHELLRLADWSQKKGIRLIVDESFADFADEADNSLMEQPLLEAYPHLLVMKSISKSYGVPGLRLGVAASGDTELISAMKKEAAIWNINSFAEFYLQIAEKYKNDYALALTRLRAERCRFQQALSEIDGMTVFPSQANYCLIRLTNGMSAAALTQTLLKTDNLLVKDLSPKLSGAPYLRVAIRNTEANNRLIAALKSVLSENQ